MIDSIKNPFQGQNQVQNDRRNEPVGSPRETTTGARGESSSDADRVDLSASARTLQSLELRVNEASGIDASRVEALRNAIDDGTYSVDSNRIAAALIRDSQTS